MPKEVYDYIKDIMKAYGQKTMSGAVNYIIMEHKARIGVSRFNADGSLKR